VDGEKNRNPNEPKVQELSAGILAPGETRRKPVGRFMNCDTRLPVSEKLLVVTPAVCSLVISRNHRFRAFRFDQLGEVRAHT
jgi:hypothetical protein